MRTDEKVNLSVEGILQEIENKTPPVDVKKNKKVKAKIAHPALVLFLLMEYNDGKINQDVINGQLQSNAALHQSLKKTVPNTINSLEFIIDDFRQYYGIEQQVNSSNAISSLLKILNEHQAVELVQLTFPAIYLLLAEHHLKKFNMTNEDIRIGCHYFIEAVTRNSDQHIQRYLYYKLQEWINRHIQQEHYIEAVTIAGLTHDLLVTEKKTCEESKSIREIILNNENKANEKEGMPEETHSVLGLFYSYEKQYETANDYLSFAANKGVIKAAIQLAENYRKGCTQSGLKDNDGAIVIYRQLIELHIKNDDVQICNELCKALRGLESLDAFDDAVAEKYNTILKNTVAKSLCQNKLNKLVELEIIKIEDRGSELFKTISFIENIQTHIDFRIHDSDYSKNKKKNNKDEHLGNIVKIKASFDKNAKQSRPDYNNYKKNITIMAGYIPEDDENPNPHIVLEALFSLVFFNLEATNRHSSTLHQLPDNMFQDHVFKQLRAAIKWLLKLRQADSFQLYKNIIKLKIQKYSEDQKVDELYPIQDYVKLINLVFNALYGDDDLKHFPDIEKCKIILIELQSGRCNYGVSDEIAIKVLDKIYEVYCNDERFQQSVIDASVFAIYFNQKIAYHTNLNKQQLNEVLKMRPENDTQSQENQSDIVATLISNIRKLQQKIDSVEAEVKYLQNDNNKKDQEITELSKKVQTQALQIQKYKDTFNQINKSNVNNDEEKLEKAPQERYPSFYHCNN